MRDHRPLELRQPAHEFGGKPVGGGLQDDSHEALPKTPRVRKMAAMSCQPWSAHRCSGFSDPGGRGRRNSSRGEGPWPNPLSTRRALTPYKNFKFRVKWDGHTIAGGGWYS